MWSNRQWDVLFCIRVKCFHPPWYLMFWSVINLAQTGGRPPGTGPVPARTGRAAGLDEPHRGASRWAEEGWRGPQSHWDRACQAPCTTKVDHTSFNFLKQNKEAVLYPVHIRPHVPQIHPLNIHGCFCLLRFSKMMCWLTRQQLRQLTKPAMIWWSPPLERKLPVWRANWRTWTSGGKASWRRRRRGSNNWRALWFRYET